MANEVFIFLEIFMSTYSVHQMDQSDEHGCADELGDLALAYEELLEKHAREVEAPARLQKSYDEMQIMVRHQQKMFTVVKQHLLSHSCSLREVYHGDESASNDVHRFII
jgi:hypothetical protein